MSTASVAANSPEPRRRRITPLVLAAVVLVCAAGGAAAWYWNGKASAQGAAKEAAKPPLFVTLEPFIVNLLPEDGERHLQVGLSLRVRDQKVADEVKLHMPEIRNGILLVLSNQRPSDVASVTGKEKLGQSITAAARRPLSEKAGADAISNVLFTSFVMQ